jgi:hypothetical protein
LAKVAAWANSPNDMPREQSHFYALVLRAYGNVVSAKTKNNAHYKSLIVFLILSITILN